MKKLIEKYIEFYKQKGFNLKPSVWKTSNNYIKRSFNNNFRFSNS